MTPQESDMQDRVSPRGPSDEAVDAVLACIAEIRPDSPPPAITEDLIRARVINSIAFVELLFVLEERSGRAVDLEGGSDRLRTVASLAEQFFGMPRVADA